MNRKIFTTALLAAALSTGGSSTAATIPAGPLAEIELLYTSGEYDKANQELTRFIAAAPNADKESRAYAYLLKARLEVAFGRSTEIRMWLGMMRELATDLAPDPVKDPPQILSAWQDLVKNSSSSRKRDPGLQKPIPPLHHDSRPSGAPVPGTYWLPFGAGHFAGGYHREGMTFLAGGVAAILLADHVAGRQGYEPSSQPTKMLRAGYFTAVYGYGLLDLSLLDLSQTRIGREHGASDIPQALHYLPFGIGMASVDSWFMALTYGLTDTVLFSILAVSEEKEARAAGALMALSWASQIYRVSRVTSSNPGTTASTDQRRGRSQGNTSRLRIYPTFVDTGSRLQPAAALLLDLY